MNKKHAATLLGAGVIFAVGVLAWPGASLADEIESSIARGAKLYDKWYKVIDADVPTKSHALYPSDKKYAKKAKSNWRCKECHGWDYSGKDGAYSKGKHYTGIKGIRAYAGVDTGKIIALLKAKEHGLAGKMEDEDFADLANFISKGQVDMDQYIDRATKTVKGGDKERGAVYFNTICIGCHAKDGTKPKDMEKPLGAQMGNPWEVMHKILNGQPAEPMPALRALDRQGVLDIMAHVATLPKKK